MLAAPSKVDAAGHVGCSVVLREVAEVSTCTGNPFSLFLLKPSVDATRHSIGRQLPFSLCGTPMTVEPPLFQEQNHLPPADDLFFLVAEPPSFR